MVGGSTFCLKFSRLFRVTTTKNLPISTTMGNNTFLFLDFTLCRNLFDAEIVDLE